MKIKFLSSALIFLLIISCNSKKTDTDGGNSSASNKKENGAAVLETVTSQGFELMSQKCFICHFAKPDPSRANQMIAPPMMRVQEHYKPAYPKKEDFVKAVMEYVKNPLQENTLMPGTIKKFNIMPKLIYDDKELQMIAGALYETDFGTAPKMKMESIDNLQLNDGHKWKLKAESMEQMNAVRKKLDEFHSTEISDYNQLGKDIFNEAKTIMLDDSYTGDRFNQIHLFFGGIENNMHSLMATKSLVEAKKQLEELKLKFEKFTMFFE